MSVDVYLLYLGALTVFFATPPDVSQFLIMANSARHGLRRSLYTVAGDLSANALQMTAAAFGLAAVITASGTAFWLLKWLGVAYLAWIGLSLMLSREGPPSAAASAGPSAAALYRQGFLTSSANPLAILFFAALFPQFIDPGAPIWPQLLILGGTYLLVDGLLLMAWGWAAEHAAKRWSTASTRRLNRVSGALMIGAAALLASRDIDARDLDARDVETPR